MSDKTIAPAKPDTVKPKTPKPKTVKPKPVTPAKAHDGVCIRCEMKPAEIRCVCSDCDLDLQTLHYSVEYRLDDHTRYIPDIEEARWFTNEGYKLTKPWAPKRRPYQRQTAEGPALILTG